MAAVVVVCLVGATAVLTLQVTHPRYDEVGPADAVVVLGEPDALSLRLAQRLLDEGVSDQLVLLRALSNPPQCASPPPGVTVTCLVPDPTTTQGDARAIGRLAAQKGWDRLVVVTWTTHVTRSRTLIEACYPGTLMMTGYVLDMGDRRLAELAHQVGGYAKALVSRGC